MASFSPFPSPPRPPRVARKGRSTPNSPPSSIVGKRSTLHNYDALRRVLFIHERLGNGHRTDAARLACELEVSVRTIKRDVEFMRSLGAPIEWDAASHTYSYTRDCDLLPLLRLDADEALALILAGKTFAAWQGSTLGRALTAALGKIAGVIGGAISLPASEIGDFISHPEEGGESDEERRVFAVALEAIRRRRPLRMAYRKPNAAAPETRLIHPLHLAFLDHRWVLVAHDPARRALRTFLLARIETARAVPGTFAPPPGFDIKTHLRGNLGRFTGGRDVEVRLLFEAALRPYVRERPWHSSQILIDRADGRVEMTLRLNNLIDVRRRILACGAQVKVLAPPELSDAIRAEAGALVRRYSGKTGP